MTLASTGRSVEWWRHTTLVPHARVFQGASSPGNSATTGNPAPFWALMVFTFVLLIAPQSFVPALAPLHIAFVTAALSGMIYVLDRFIRRKPIIEFTPEMRVVACLAAWAIVTIPLSIWPGGSVSMLLDIYVKALVIFWLLSRVVDTPARLRFVAWLLSLIAVPLALSGVRSYFSGGFAHQEISHGLDRIAGYEASLTGNPNDLALMLNLILPLTIALLFAARKPMTRVLLLAIIGSDVAAIIATFSRGGFLTLGVIVAAYTWLLIRRHQHKLVLLIIAAAMTSVPFLPSSYINRLSTITDIQADRTGSAQQRWSGSVAAVEYIVSHPLTGAGIGMNILALNKIRGAAWVEVHDIYLVYAMELGIPGLIMFLLLLRGAFRNAHRAKALSAKDLESADFHYLAEGIGVSLLAFALAAFFYPDAYQFYFYYFAGLAAAAKHIATITDGKTDAESRIPITTGEPMPCQS